MQLRLEKRPEPSRFMLYATPVWAVVLTMIVGAIIFSIIGYNGLAAVYEMFIAPLALSYKWSAIAVKASPLLLIGVGPCLLMAQTWARIASIVLVCLHAVTQVAWLGAYPVWGLLMIALDVLVLYALTARWTDVRGELGVGSGTELIGQEAADLPAAERRRPPLS